MTDLSKALLRFRELWNKLFADDVPPESPKEIRVWWENNKGYYATLKISQKSSELLTPPEKFYGGSILKQYVMNDLIDEAFRITMNIDSAENLMSWTNNGKDYI